MRHPVLLRAVALALALVAASSVSGLAVTHGLAHLEAGVERHSHEHLEHRAAANHAALDDADAPMEHPHPTVSAPFAAGIGLPILIALPTQDLPVASIAHVEPPPPESAIAVGDAPLYDSPRAARAPPLG